MATGQVRSFASAVTKASRGSLGAARVQEILLAAKTSLARDRVDVANEMAIRNTVAEIELLDEQISAWDAEIRAIEMPGRELLQGRRVAASRSTSCQIVFAHAGTSL